MVCGGLSPQQYEGAWGRMWLFFCMRTASPTHSLVRNGPRAMTSPRVRRAAGLKTQQAAQQRVRVTPPQACACAPQQAAHMHARAAQQSPPACAGNFAGALPRHVFQAPTRLPTTRGTGLDALLPTTTRTQHDDRIGWQWCGKGDRPPIHRWCYMTLHSVLESHRAPAAPGRVQPQAQATKPCPRNAPQAQ